MAARFARKETEHEHPTQDMDYFKLKFDRLSNTKKPMGDTFCPQNVPRAKQIAGVIFSRVHSSSVGDESDSENANSEGETGGSRKRDAESKPLRARKNWRVDGTRGIRWNERDDGDLMEYVGEMSRAVTDYVRGKGSQTTSTLSATQEEFEVIVREQIRQKLKETNGMLQRTKKCIDEME